MTNAYEVTPDDVLEVLNERTEPVLSTAEVEDRLHEEGVEISRPTVLRRLKKLHERDEIENKTIGQITVWWVKGDRIVTDAEEVLTSDGGSKLDAEDEKPEGLEKWESRGQLSLIGLIIGGLAFTYFVTSSLLFSLPYSQIVGGFSILFIVGSTIGVVASLVMINLKQREIVEETNHRLADIRDRMIPAPEEDAMEPASTEEAS